EPPELEDKPVVVGERAVVLAVENACSLEWVETNVVQDRPVDLDGRAQPAVWLIRETVLVVVEANSGQGAFGEVENFVSLRRALPCAHGGLVVPIEVDLVRRPPDQLALGQLRSDVRIAGE